MEEKNIEKSKEMKSEIQEIKRPWQGSFLFYFHVLFSVIFSVLSIIGLSTLIFSGVNEYFTMILMLKFHILPFIIMLFVILLIPISIYFIFLSRGFYKGWKWVVVITIFSSGMNILNILSELVRSNFSFLKIFQLFISILLLYFSFFCLNHPFYNKK